jgi:hypothetical protein
MREKDDELQLQDGDEKLSARIPPTQSHNFTSGFRLCNHKSKQIYQTGLAEIQ